MILKEIKDPSLFSEKAESEVGVFASLKWLSVYGNQLRLIGIYKDENQLIGGFYFVKIKKFGFNFIKLPPYTPHCALFFNSTAKNSASLQNFSKEIMQEICNYLDKEKSALSILAFPYKIKDLQHFIWNNYKVIPNYTYLIDLKKPFEDIKANFDSKHRNAISKAIKDGVEVKCNSENPEFIFSFLKNSLLQAGANVYESELRSILTQFSNENNSFTFIAYHNQSVVGMLHCIYDKNVCYYLLGGVAKEAGVQGVNHLLVQNALAKAIALNCSIFDFEGSMLKGVEKFFRGFGPELVPYYTVNKASLFIELILKFKKRSIF
ncbi:MAG: GNAT family N-acetyltransferase [Sphingobacteriaceae bacterium]|nr:GNAT family N-acetyltransferase [Sphingobacteriaceae bacterium]